jgi:hypothetical protein
MAPMQRMVQPEEATDAIFIFSSSGNLPYMTMRLLLMEVKLLNLFYVA